MPNVCKWQVRRRRIQNRLLLECLYGSEDGTSLSLTKSMPDGLRLHADNEKYVYSDTSSYNKTIRLSELSVSNLRNKLQMKLGDVDNDCEDNPMVIMDTKRIKIESDVDPSEDYKVPELPVFVSVSDLKNEPQDLENPEAKHIQIKEELVDENTDNWGKPLSHVDIQAKEENVKNINNDAEHLTKQNVGNLQDSDLMKIDISDDYKQKSFSRSGNKELPKKRAWTQIEDPVEFYCPKCKWKLHCGDYIPGDTCTCGTKFKIKLAKCELCNEYFSRPSVLDRHLSSHSLEERKLIASGHEKHKCELCNKCFCTKREMSRHIETDHCDFKNIKCEMCEKCFNKNSELSRHLLTHVNPRDMTCNICRRKFTLREHLYRHILVHSGDKKLMCEQCGGCFKLLSNLYLHKRYSHDNVEINNREQVSNSDTNIKGEVDDSEEISNCDTDKNSEEKDNNCEESINSEELLKGNNITIKCDEKN